MHLPGLPLYLMPLTLHVSEQSPIAGHVLKPQDPFSRDSLQIGPAATPRDIGEAKQVQQ